ncbi:hypothetical protein EDB84DRAFT_1463058 [Lactarius hengduanensis]|nr:hypothetical protein EDB84DRAFT_1463058 [Lactarius hengduanensis]
MGASSGCPEPAKGRLTGCHNGKTGTGNVYVQRTSPFDRIYPLPPTSMAKRKMRTSKSLLVACLPIFASLASAQLIYPNCTAGWEWSSNSLGQNPCNVAAYLEATCGTGLFKIDPLPQGSLYRGPDVSQSNLCECNTVVYSLVSACGACQGSSEWIQYVLCMSMYKFCAVKMTFFEVVPMVHQLQHCVYRWNVSKFDSGRDADTSLGISPGVGC